MEPPPLFRFGEERERVNELEKEKGERIKMNIKKNTIAKMPTNTYF